MRCQKRHTVQALPPQRHKRLGLSATSVATATATHSGWSRSQTTPARVWSATEKTGVRAWASVTSCARKVCERWISCHRLLALTAFSVLFLTLAGVAVWQVRTRLRQGSQLFAASLAELQQDRDALQS